MADPNRRFIASKLQILKILRCNGDTITKKSFARADECYRRQTDGMNSTQLKSRQTKLHDSFHCWLACCCSSTNDEDAVLTRKQTDGENEDDSVARNPRILTRRFCHRYDNEDRMLEYLRSCVDVKGRYTLAKRTDREYGPCAWLVCTGLVDAIERRRRRSIADIDGMKR